jgi:hypothetical protein
MKPDRITMKPFPLLLFLLIAFSLPGTSSAEELGEAWGAKSVENIGGWIKEFDHVEAVVYHPSEKNPAEPPVLDGKPSKGIAKAWTKRLTPEQTGRLVSFITGKRKSSGDAAACYLPHHGFIFYDKDSKIVGHLAICFMCGNYRPSPKEGLSHPWDLGGLSALITELGLPMFRKPDEVTAFFADKEKLERGPEAGQNGR